MLSILASCSHWTNTNHPKMHIIPPSNNIKWRTTRHNYGRHTLQVPESWLQDEFGFNILLLQDKTTFREITLKPCGMYLLVLYIRGKNGTFGDLRVMRGLRKKYLTFLYVTNRITLQQILSIVTHTQYFISNTQYHPLIPFFGLKYPYKLKIICF